MNKLVVLISEPFLVSEDQQEVVNLEVVEGPLPLGHRRRHVQRLFDHDYGHHRWLKITNDK